MKTKLLNVYYFCGAILKDSRNTTRRFSVTYAERIQSRLSVQIKQFSLLALVLFNAHAVRESRAKLSRIKFGKRQHGPSITTDRRERSPFEKTHVSVRAARRNIYIIYHSPFPPPYFERSLAFARVQRANGGTATQNIK